MPQLYYRGVAPRTSYFITVILFIIRHESLCMWRLVCMLFAVGMQTKQEEIAAITKL